MGIPSRRPARTMATATYRVFDPLLPRAQAERMLRVCERFGAYGMYSQESSEAQIGQGLFQRHDAVMNFLKTGGRFGRHDSIASLGARTNYFRESYAYGDEVRIDGIEPFLRYEGFVEAARAIHGRPVLEPAIVYANLLVPGRSSPCTPTCRSSVARTGSSTRSGSWSSCTIRGSSTSIACRSRPPSAGSMTAKAASSPSTRRVGTAPPRRSRRAPTPASS